ncbi:Mitogen-activated protein kinase kinase kinase YODA [Colletotrichum chlorophyti]|uniref:non-specific serine/threonine protein kinase n=1 Tax=Colletotrichum chlorophyti TaxID=708187 RepID=A0A1Q8RS08_9PEZI|nr:Mitogen-activated protein kinase kinase kinase YODA [Colletotrichum chlorophyti]
MVDNLDDGWTTVHHQSQVHPERLPHAQRELYEASLIKEWEATQGHWSGVGKHPDDFVEAKKIHHRIIAPKDNNLGMGSFGLVEKVSHRSVCLARKWIKPQRNQKFSVLRREALAMERLDHEHIVKLVGTYTFKQRELYLLIWPVAVCNLAELLTDLEDLTSGQGDRDDILKRLDALDITDVRAVGSGGRHPPTRDATSKCPLRFLQSIMGCIAQAVAHCHASHVRHLDLKPSNILLNPNRVYLADFGIARDVNDQDNTATIGPHGTPKWRPPEAYRLEEYSSQSADIYSLGLVYLHIATLVYHGAVADFHSVLDELLPGPRADKLQKFQQNLAFCALATQQFHDVERPTVTPKHVLGLTEKMTSLNSSARPRANDVDQELVDLGGIEQVYHNACCQKSTRHVAHRIDRKLAAAYAEITQLKPENDSLKADVEVWKALSETYRSRLENQEKKHARDTEYLTRHLNEEKAKRRNLEERVKELEMQTRRHGRSGFPRADVVTESRTNPSTVALASVNGLGITPRPRTHPIQKAAIKPPPPSTVPRPTLAKPIPSDRLKVSKVRGVHGRGNKSDISETQFDISETQSIPRTLESPSLTVTLPSRGSASRLPVLAKSSTTPHPSTPKLGRDPSLTDSTQASMASSILSRTSFETSMEALTPPAVSPAVKQAVFDVHARDTKSPAGPSTPVRSAPLSGPPVLSSPRSAKVEWPSNARNRAPRAGLAAAKSPPPLQTAKSWAAIAGESVGQGLAKMVGSPASAAPAQSAKILVVSPGKTVDRRQ